MKPSPQMACHCRFEALTAFSERSFSRFGSRAAPAPCLLETVTTPGTAPVCKYDWGLESATSAGAIMQDAYSGDCQQHCNNKITSMKDRTATPKLKQTAQAELPGIMVYES